MRRRWWTIVVLGLVAAACSSGGGGAGAGLSKAACSASADLAGTERSLDEPHVFTLPAERLTRVLDRRAQALRRLAKAVDDDQELHADVVAYAADVSVVKDAIVTALTQHHDEVVAVGTGWESALASGPLVTEDQRSAYGRLAIHWSIRFIATACENPDELHRPKPDDGPKVEGGTVVYDAYGDGDHGLRAISSRGGTAVDIGPPAGWDDLDFPSVGHDGKTLVAVARRSGATGLAVGTLATGFQVIRQFDGAELTCPRQAPDGTILVSLTTQTGSPAQLLRVSATGDAASIVTLPLQSLLCADQLTDGALLLGSASRDRTQHGAFSRIAAGSSFVEDLYEPEGCLATPYALSPDEHEELLSTTCPSSGGLFAIDLRTRKASEVFDGLAGAPAYSPSGKWIAFGYIPVARPKDVQIRVWLIRRDGKGLRQLTTDRSSSWPAWVSDPLP